MDGAHAPAAAARGGLDDQRVADGPGRRQRLALAGHRTVAPGHDRHSGLLHHLARNDLVAHRLDRAGGGTDERDLMVAHDLRETRIFRQKTVARMDRVDTQQFGRAHDVGDFEV
jgi:hypothetical protein